MSHLGSFPKQDYLDSFTAVSRGKSATEVERGTVIIRAHATAEVRKRHIEGVSADPFVVLGNSQASGSNAPP